MSYVQAPTLPISMAKGLAKAPVFNVVFQPNAANRGNASTTLTPYPTWKFSFDMDRITGNEADSDSTIALWLSLYMQTYGGAALFLFTDQQDSTVTYSTGTMLDVTPVSATPMAQTGNGTSTDFQLARLIGGAAVDILQNVTVTGIKVNGDLLDEGDYTVSDTGVVTFAYGSPAAGPPADAALTWAGTFQYLCRFSKESIDMTRAFTTNSGTDQWNLSGITFSSEFV